MADRPITNELVVAYRQCKRKAHFLLDGKLDGIEHEYQEVLTKRAQVNRSEYFSLAEHSIHPSNSGQNVTISAGDLEASCDALIQRKRRNPREHVPHQPHLVVGKHSVTNEQRISLAFAGYVVGEARRYRPKTGYIVTIKQNLRHVHLGPLYSTIQTSIHELRQLRSSGNSRTPPLFLNEHCPTCPFRGHCHEEAEQNDNLSVLERMTPKLFRTPAKDIAELFDLSKFPDLPAGDASPTLWPLPLNSSRPSRLRIGLHETEQYN